MGITHEDFQKARRISRAIQEYLETTNQEGIRSTDVYPYLAKKGLIQKDSDKGMHLRRFLIKLKENNLLSLIPQCNCNPGLENQFNEWYFYKAKSDLHEVIINEVSNEGEIPIIMPAISEKEIGELIIKAKPHIDRLPKREPTHFTVQEKETRENYPRAFEYWTDREYEIMVRAFKKFQRVEKVAELLERQPSMIERKLRELKLIQP
jgi:hypothetical protein